MINFIMLDDVKEYPSLDEQTLKEVQFKADALSMKMKNQTAPAQDGMPAKDLVPLRTAKFNPGYQDYLEFEKAGDENLPPIKTIQNLTSKTLALFEPYG